MNTKETLKKKKKGKRNLCGSHLKSTKNRSYGYEMVKLTLEIK